MSRPQPATLAWEPRPPRVRQPGPNASRHQTSSRAGAARRATHHRRPGAPKRHTGRPGGLQSTHTLQLTGCGFNAQRQSSNSPHCAGGPGAAWLMGHLPFGPAERSEVQRARRCGQGRARTCQREPAVQASNHAQTLRSERQRPTDMAEDENRGKIARRATYGAEAPGGKWALGPLGVLGSPFILSRAP